MRLKSSTVLLIYKYGMPFLYIDGFDNAIVYFFSYLFRLIQRINDLPDFIS